MNQNSQAARLEVCQGPDCLGAGGGAALLELEELVQEYTMGDIRVVRGGCRNFCSMGPNVHYRQVQQFTKVADPVECQTIVRSIIRGEAEDDSSSSGAENVPITTTLLQRKADRQRWQALRLVSRIQTSTTVVSSSQVESARAQLRQALALEQTAAHPPDSRLRSKRREHRLIEATERVIEENAELSDDEEF